MRCRLAGLPSGADLGFLYPEGQRVAPPGAEDVRHHRQGRLPDVLAIHGGGFTAVDPLKLEREGG